MDTSGLALPGTLLDGRYRVGAAIARGGMSTVYRGVDLRLDRPVAIKVMSPGYVSDPAFLARFEREARMAATLHHPGVVAVYDQGRDGETVFLVMELVDGGTLRDLLRQSGALSVPVTLSILESLLGALGAAHAAGLVHRDVKPENVLISGRGEVKVADFGLVRAVTSQTMATGDVILGTVAYLSPEQVSTGASDERSDVYAAGIVAYEMLTGFPPFSGDNAISVAYQHVHSDVPPVTDQAPGVPLELDELVLAATRRDPAARPRDATAFLSAVVSLRARLGLRRVPVPVPVRPPMFTPAPATDRSGSLPLNGTRTDLGATRQAQGPQGTRMVPLAPLPTPHPRNGPGTPTATTVQPAVGGAAVSVVPDRTTSTAVRGAPQRRHPVRRWLIAILIMLLLGTAAAVGGWWLGSGRWAYTPASVGKDQHTAETLVRQAGLVPAVTTAPDNSVPSGRVLRTDPAAGTRKLRGSQIDLVVSTGRPRVPEITAGSPIDVARAAVTAARLTPVFDRRTDAYDDRIAPGLVLRTSPVAGTALPLSGRVTLVRSLGPAPRPVPEVAGKTVEDASNALLAGGFTVGRSIDRYSGDVPAGSVLGSQPGAGASAPKGAAVSLVMAVSLTVPDVRGRPQDEAAAQLRAAGFAVTIGDPVFDADLDAGQAVSTSPAAGTRVDPAAPAVVLAVSNAVTVPSVTGGNVNSATDALAAVGLGIHVSALIGAGGSPVIDQSPSAGSRVEPGTVVAVSAFP